MKLTNNLNKGDIKMKLSNGAIKFLENAGYKHTMSINTFVNDVLNTMEFSNALTFLEEFNEMAEKYSLEFHCGKEDNPEIEIVYHLDPSVDHCTVHIKDYIDHLVFLLNGCHDINVIKIGYEGELWIQA